MASDEGEIDESTLAITQVIGPMITGPTASGTDARMDELAREIEAGALDDAVRLGRYIILEELGHGGMGVVYAAYDPKLERKVAIKQLHVQADSKLRHRLVREAQALAKLSHPNVVPVYEIDEIDEFDSADFIVMEHVEGLTLREWLTETPRSHAEILVTFKAAGRGLVAAHDKGLVHRDFKPDNVMVGSDGRVRVMDFGLARFDPRDAEAAELGVHERAEVREGLTKTGTLVGSPAYMAPEQLRGERADPRSDQFAYCVTLYEALYGTRPFVGRTLGQLREAIESRDIREPTADTDVQAWLRAAVLRGLELAPEDRYESMQELLDAVEAGERRAKSGPSSWSADWTEPPRQGNDVGLRRHRVIEGEAQWSENYERDELIARRTRMRQILIWGGVAWISFLPTDVSYNAMRGDNNELSFVSMRLLTAACLVAWWVWLGRRPTASRRVLALCEATGTSLAAGSTAVMALLNGGFESPLLPALLPILFVRALAIPDPWRWSLPIMAAPTLSFWLVLVAGRAIEPGLAELSASTVSTIILNLEMVCATVGMLVVVSHVAWQVRRQLYKARSVGRYELLHLLGRRDEGEVWAAWHQGLRLELAIELLPVADADKLDRLQREAAPATKLRHPNTARLYDFGLTPDGYWYHARELLEGESLDQLVAREGPLALTRSLRLLRQTARAVDEAHRHGIVHGDLHPRSVFVSTPAGERDVVKVLDFAMAAVSREARRQRLERPKSKPPGDGDDRGEGTDATERVTDPLLDIHGLGRLFYFMLTGQLVGAEQRERPPSEHPTTPPPSTLLASPLPDCIEQLAMRCLAERPASRYANANSLVQAIDACMGQATEARGEWPRPRMRPSNEQFEVATRGPSSSAATTQGSAPTLTESRVQTTEARHDRRD